VRSKSYETGFFFDNHFIVVLSHKILWVGQNQINNSRI
jgi:hypothetical protein